MFLTNLLICQLYFLYQEDVAIFRVHILLHSLVYKDIKSSLKIEKK